MAELNLEQLVSNPEGRRLHFVGIKGTGMTALTEVLHQRGAVITGSDVPETFYTDELLAALGVPVRVGWREENVPDDAEAIIYSAAYSADNRELAEGDRRGLPRATYPEVLGALSRVSMGLAVAGVHGKTTTTGIAGSIVDVMGIPATVVAGSAIVSFGNRSTLQHGERYLVAETCEYRRNFLHFNPRVLLITSVESDHQDFFPTLEDMYDAFVAFGERVAPDGAVVYCADDTGAVEVASRIRSRRTDLRFLSYGEGGEIGVSLDGTGAGRSSFAVPDLDPTGESWTLAVPGRHTILNAVGAVAALRELLTAGGDAFDVAAARRGVAAYRGAKRRSEIVGEAAGVLILDDYGHHPTAIETTLAGYRDFYPGRRLIVDFMPHTVSRTAAMVDRFARAFGDAAVVIVNGIYASARESAKGAVTAADLVREMNDYRDEVYLEEDFVAAAERVVSTVRPGDIFLTLGAGDNFRIGRMVLDRLQERTS